ncbi:hypothetical protein ES703_34566 [subsurface metagenome]
MALINFQERFADDVESGKKRQTIRKKRKYPIKLNETLYLYTGLRTKKARKLREDKCKSLEEVGIFWYGIMLSNKRTPTIQEKFLNEFAQADGFDNFYEMTKWFDKVYGLPFEGVLIKW